MQIAQALAGYSLGDADNLRRAMGKKKAEEMAKERERFLAGVARSRTAAAPKRAAEIFDQMETFAAYGFNKSHSAAYAVITYQTAYLKAHYRTEFMAGLLSLEAGDTDSTYKNIAECRARGIAILPPDVNESREDFTAVGDAHPLRARRREGRRLEGHRDRPRRARATGRSPACTTSACACAAQQVNRRVIESLIACGAFDSIERNRARLWAALDDALRWAGAAHAGARRARSSGSSAAAPGAPSSAPPALPAVAPWTRRGGAAARARDARLLHHRSSPRSLRERPAPLHQRHRGDAAHAGARAARGAVAPGRPDGRPRVRLGGVIHTVRLRN